MSQAITQRQCDPPNYSNSQCNGLVAGITTWNLDNQYTIPLLTPYGTSGDSATLTFTCTDRKCHSGKDACLVVFNAWSHDNDPNNLVKLKYRLNNTDIGGSAISGVATHGATQSFDIAPVTINGNEVYHDTIMNTFVIQNLSQDTVQVDHFKIYRTYLMCDLITDSTGQCTIDGMCDYDHTPGTSGSLDQWRNDTPCNCETGGGLSYTQVHDTSYQGTTIPVGGTLTCTFDFSDYSGGNYQQSSICVFGFNEMWLSSAVSGEGTLVARLNGQEIDRYYLNRWGSSNAGMFPAHDLATSGAYRDTGANTVELINQSAAPVVTASSWGGFDIYRIFKTSTLSDRYYYVEVSAGPEGNVAPNNNCGTILVAHHTNQTFTISPNTGYGIDHVDVDGTSVGTSSTYTFSTVVANHTIAAYFKQVRNITASAYYGGEISPSGTIQVDYNGTQGFTITALPCYQIDYLVINGNQDYGLHGQTSGTYTFHNVVQNQSIGAFFLQIPYSITSSAGSGGTISPSGQVVVLCGQNQAFTITPDSGYVISAVHVNGSNIGTPSTYTFQDVMANGTITAYFSQPCGLCNTSCMTQCETSCQTGCEVSCQTTCELECQDCQNCEISCMTECNVSCQTTCEITCQTGCEVGCQTGCEVACQTGCEVACQTGCEVSCQSGCEVGCETCQDCQYCEVMCMTPCDLCETN